MKPHIIHLVEGRTNRSEDPRLSDLPIAIHAELAKGTRIVVTVAGNEIASLPLASHACVSAKSYRGE